MVDNKQLVDQYKEKNDTLPGIVKEYKEYKDQYDRIKHELDSITLEKNTMAIDLKEALRNIGTLNTKINDLESKHKEIVESINIKNTEFIENLKNGHKDETDKLKQRHSEEIDHITQKAEIEKDRTALQIKNEYNEKIENIRNEYNDKIKSLFNDLQISKASTIEKEEKKDMKGA